MWFLYSMEKRNLQPSITDIDTGGSIGDFFLDGMKEPLRVMENVDPSYRLLALNQSYEHQVIPP
jgi:hypothetical protein